MVKAKEENIFLFNLLLKFRNENLFIQEDEFLLFLFETTFVSSTLLIVLSLTIFPSDISIILSEYCLTSCRL